MPRRSHKFVLPLLVSICISALLLASCERPSFGRPTDTPTALPATDTPLPPTATAVPAAATVNGEVIPLADFQAELERYKAAQSALGKTVSDDEAKKTVLDDLIGQTLLAQAAEKQDYSVDDAALQKRIDGLNQQIGGGDALSKWESAHGYTDDEFRASLRREMEAAWMRDKIIAGVPTTAEQVHVRQILFYNEDRAKQVYQDLLTGRTDFDKMAALVDPVMRGDIGWFPRGYLPFKAIEQSAFALQPGQMSDVVQTDLGYHIIKVLDRGQHPLSADALLTLQDKAVQDWVTQQRQQSKIVASP